MTNESNEHPAASLIGRTILRVEMLTDPPECLLWLDDGQVVEFGIRSMRLVKETESAGGLSLKSVAP